MSEATDSSGGLLQPSGVKNWREWAGGWLPSGLGIGFWIVSFRYPGFAPPQLIDLFGIFSCLAMSTATHEFAHFGVGRLLGLNPWCVSIGHGKVVYDREFRLFRLVLRAVPYSGAVYPLGRLGCKKGGRWREFAATLAGPLSDALLLCAALLLLNAGATTKDGHSSAWTAGHIYADVVVASAISLFFCLVPFRFMLNGVMTPNDALIMWGLLTGKMEQGAAPSSTAESQPEDVGPSWKWIANNLPARSYLQLWRDYLDRKDLPVEERLLALDTFATAVLMYGDRDFLPEADRYSQELCEKNPGDWTVMGTRGSILVEKGEIEAGRAMLHQVFANGQTAFERGIAASFLAMAALKQGDRSGASDWLSIARKTDPQCATLQRIAEMLRASAPVE